MEEKKSKKSHLPFRLNILFFIVFMLFSSLILRLGYVQIVQGQEYEVQLEKTVNISSPVEAPRGLIYDRYGNLIVDNELLFTVTYTNRSTPTKEMLETARKLNQYITVESSRVNDRDLKEYWSVLYPDEFEEKLTVAEAKERDLSDSDAHDERLAAISEEELAAISKEDMEVFHIWREFTAGYNNLPTKVKRGIAYKEAAEIMENLEDLPGVEIIRDSERVYLYGDTLRSIIGNVGAIPSEQIDYYLANGYARNDTVGTSYLEAQYESVLRGNDGRLDNYMDTDGNILKNPEEILGSRGNDLVLSIDMELQQLAKSAVENNVKKYQYNFIGEPDAYAVVMEPNTGEVLAMVGYNSDLGTFTNSFVVGSSIKGATVLAGLDYGVISPGQYVLDRTLNLPGGVSISSHSPLGYVNHLSALERSSNIYMAEIAMRIIGYAPGVSGTNWGNFYLGYDVLRSYYSQFGLGVKTEIDLPNESAGINGGNIAEPGKMLYLSFGQFDTYTPLQLAQYVSTIANGGYRIAPQVVKEIREPGEDKNELGSISQQLEPKVLNKLSMDESYIDEVKKGFYLVTHGSNGTAAGYFKNEPYDAAGKTGTAQVFVDGKEANNLTFVAYAPYDNPEVAVAVVVPGVSKSTSGINNEIAKDILGHYFDLKKERKGPMHYNDTSGNDDSDSDDQ
ncbi:Cell division protein FtsI/penicillin-binding protein 2 [Evansella caseinilytica]|uniref:serine-type D-Ala-D-Ala carboxypeptidase n=1 Tax=Evansella caseinilytica TaxID=1503961 RepID=A0A1H3P3R1_9BACI|nr:penicillin-binding protein 2 [Evansella caseinilytica]SDY95039.1 Cell division protein FtsI/penicillin-binding protein 2 [Evansella caseinilytica]